MNKKEVLNLIKEWRGTSKGSGLTGETIAKKLTSMGIEPPPGNSKWTTNNVSSYALDNGLPNLRANERRHKKPKQHATKRATLPSRIMFDDVTDKIIAANLSLDVRIKLLEAEGLS